MRLPRPKPGLIGAAATLSAALLPVLIGGGVIAYAGRSMADALFGTLPDLGNPGPGNAVFVNLALNDTTWLLLLLTIAIVVAFVGGFSIVRYSEAQRVKVGLFAVAGVLATVLSAIGWLPAFDVAVVGMGVFSSRIAHLPEVAWLRTSLHLGMTLTCSGLVLIAVASAALVLRLDAVAARIRDYPPGGDAFQTVQIASALRGRLVTLRILTAAGGVLLVTAVWKLCIYLGIPGPYQIMTFRLLLVQGAAFSVSLFGMFIVPFGMLKTQARSFAVVSGAVSKDDIAAFGKRHRLNASWPTALWNAATVALPVLWPAPPLIWALIDWR